MCAKYYENPTMLSKVTAKNVGDVFFETHCIASSHCAWQVSLPSVELELMIRVSPRPRIFRHGPSASVRGRCEKLADARMRPRPHISDTHATVIISDRASLLSTAHTVKLRCAASLSADCGYNPG